MKRPLLAAFVLLPCVLVSVARAQYTSDFESGTINASVAGTTLTGQGPGAGYYLPNATSVDFQAHTYANNPYGISQNPTGGCQFVAGTGPGAGIFARAQLDITYPAGAAMTAAFDCCAVFGGTLPASQNAGSFSIQPFPGSQSFIALARWSNTAVADTWNADYVRFDAAGAQFTSVVANPAFQGLANGRWYRWETDYDLTTNAITALRITDLSTGITVSDAPVGWYMEGGAIGSSTPTGFRFFGGGGNPGNTLAFDNLCIDAQGACVAPPATVPNYQINSSAASMRILGQTDGGYCAPAFNTVGAGVPFQLEFDSTLTGSMWEVAQTTGPLVPASGGGITLPGGDILNVNFGDPSLTLTFNLFASPPFTGPLVATLSIPVPATVRAQFGIVDPSSLSGYRLSQALDVLSQ